MNKANKVADARKYEKYTGMWLEVRCPECNWCNPMAFKPDLLVAPIDYECNRIPQQGICGVRWSVAIPLGDCPARSEILDLLETAKQYEELQWKVAVMRDKLYGANQ